MAFHNVTELLGRLGEGIYKQNFGTYVIRAMTVMRGSFGRTSPAIHLKKHLRYQTGNVRTWPLRGTHCGFAVRWNGHACGECGECGE